jgi:AhpC/TSA family
VRPPVDHIEAPPFPRDVPWINATAIPVEQLLGQPVLIEFWDFCRPNSIRTLPYMKAWHERYESAGLRVIGVHASGFPPSADPEAVRAAVERLGIRYPVVIDVGHEIWQLYDNLGWPARYLWRQNGTLDYYHYGEGAYAETEEAIQQLLEVRRPVLAPRRPEDAPGALLEPQSEDVEGPYSGRYQAGAVWVVVDGEGSVSANGHTVVVDHPGCYELISHERSTRGELALGIGSGVRCHATCFSPGLAA